jgi:thiol:disulfide interchange protein DsbD
MKINTPAFLALLLLFQINTAISQILEPVKWRFSTEKIAENEYNLVFTADIDPTWYLYSQDIAMAPPATVFSFEPAEGFQLIGNVNETDAIEKYDPNFEMVLKFFEHQAVFRQKVKVTAANPVTIKGAVEFMSCDDSRCLPPDLLEFTFTLPGRTAAASPQEPAAGPIAETMEEAAIDEAIGDLAEEEAPAEELIQYTTETSATRGSFWGIFLTGILGGLLALLTPCVFPMIPITVSFFLRNAGNRTRAFRDALFYGITIVFAYVVLGLAISMIFGANTLNALATSPWFNIFFFALLVFFAASFFGMFELTMPSRWSNALDSKADKTGGLVSVFFMGLTFVLVSFSCTGPIVGTLLVEAATSGDVLSPAIGMLGFSLALAIPFSLFAVFPTTLQSLPKSGGWMNSVKVVLGFIVLAFALKFLGTADAVAQWGLLDREVFISLWIAIFMLLGMYLIGKVRFAHDSELKYLSVPRLILAILVFSFVFYLIPGLWGAPLRAISSFLPSPTTQDFDLSRGVVTGANTTVAPSTIYTGESVKQGPHGLLAFTDYNEGLAAAKKAGKPIFLDFTGLGCVNCRKMEANVWSDQAVLQMLANEFVKISLFVDDRTSLPEEQQFVSSAMGRERTIRTVGQKWSVFQAERFGVNTQPYYLILNHDEELLAPPYGYDANIAKYLEFLETGKNNFYK